MTASSKKELFGQPVGLFLISFTSIWERFSYYGMRAILILYMANELIASNKFSFRGGLGFSESNAGLIYGFFTSMCYFLPLLGGIIADKYIGKRRSVLIGGFLIMFGHFTLATDSGLVPFFSGLVLLAIGNGFFKPSAPSMIGELYTLEDKRRDSAFTIYYTLFNGGACLAPILCGYFGETYAYRYGFLTAGFGMMLGLIGYMLLAPKYLGEIGKKPKPIVSEVKIEKAPLTKEEKDRITVIFILLAFVIFFWSGFEQAGSTLTLFTDKYVDKSIFGWQMPTSWFQAINPVFILILGPLFSMLWMSLAKKKKDISSPSKMGIGMIFLGLGFVFMLFAIIQRGGNNPDINIKANLMWVVMTYLLHTIGELCLSPIGLSMVTKLAPARMVSTFIAVWFLSSTIANFIAGVTVSFVVALGDFNVFLIIALLVGILGVVVLLLSNKLLKMMHGIS